MGAFNYYIGPWVWDDRDPEMPSWNVPAGTVGLIDLRGIPDQSLAGVLGSRPYGFFAVSGTLPREYTLLGSGDLREINTTAAMKSVWLSLFGYEPQGDKLADLLFDYLTNGSDPTFNDDTVPSLMPNTKGVLEMHLGGHSLVKAARFRYGIHSHTNKTQAALHRNYRRMRAEVEAGRMFDGHERKVLDFWVKKYKLKGDDWKQLVPAELRDGHSGPLPHDTTITESFNTGDSDTLGPDLSWTELEGDWDIVTNAAEVASASGQQVVIKNIVGSASANRGVIARKDSSATLSYYHFDAADNGGATDTWRTFKRVSGSFTAIGSNTTVDVVADDVIKGQTDGSTIKRFRNGSEQDSATDSAISGNLRCGLNGNVLAGNNGQRVDAFEAADLAAGTRHPLVMGSTNLLRGKI